MKKIIGVIAGVMIISAIIVMVLLMKPAVGVNKLGNKLTVSILPLKFILSNIVGDDYDIEIMVPPGSSPETYEPTPQQLISIADTKLIFTTGLLDFERELIHRLTKQTDNKIVNLSKGIELLDGCCCSAKNGDHDHVHGGIDPHIWMSPKQLKIMAKNAYEAISLLHPANETYQNNYKALISKLEYLDTEVDDLLKQSNVKYYLIYHPALTYYANDYDLHQLAIEQDGKEPSAIQLRDLIETARRENIKIVLYQKEFNKNVVETIAKDIGAIPMEIDPLAENIDESILQITRSISGQNL